MVSIYPIKIKASARFIQELYGCEYGRYEDALAAREANDVELIDANDYAVVFCDFGDRWKTMIECRNDQELCELYYACASGTIGVVGFNRSANKVLDQIRDRVLVIDPKLVVDWPRQEETPALAS
ncbi:MAG: hypothetical protein RSG77_18310 [Hafnia sp.]